MFPSLPVAALDGDSERPDDEWPNGHGKANAKTNSQTQTKHWSNLSIIVIQRRNWIARHCPTCPTVESWNVLTFCRCWNTPFSSGLLADSELWTLNSHETEIWYQIWSSKALRLSQSLNSMAKWLKGWESKAGNNRQWYLRQLVHLFTSDCDCLSLAVRPKLSETNRFYQTQPAQP
jgi:hypothetical protein